MPGEDDKPGASRAEKVFSGALELPPDKRQDYLAAACGDDLKLRKLVEALLRAHEAPAGFLPEEHGNMPAEARLALDVQPSALTEQTGDCIGPYKLLQKIGEGGCGVVYMAKQEEPVRRRVALKIIKLGMDTRQVVARFEAERQALAMMDHPNIAKILEAGATEMGRPYFVMELVGGIKITDYCDQNQLTTRQRLHLFIQICRAIQHAHQKGVIHRDIKPSNVLVATQDGAPVPKVIDFGISKATQGRLTDQTVFTAFEQFLGTPAYMSPEQAQLGSLDVDTRSDIYSLGVLLYELLTGKTPFDAKELLAVGLEAMRKTICEKEPPTPSTRLKQELVARSAGSEKSAPHTPRSSLAKDLDWIVMKCLEKDRARRYETANGLAHDIERYLNNEPIMARPPSRFYEFQKTVRRHKFGFAATAAIIAALFCGIVATTLEMVRARRLQNEAQAARRDAREMLWASYVAEAHALRLSGQAGRRFGSLVKIRGATRIRPSLALRNEAIASMILPDIQWVERKDFNKASEFVFLEPKLEKYAVYERTGAVSIRRVADDNTVARLPDVGAAPTAGILEFSLDGRFLAVLYRDGQCRVWDWAKPAIAAQCQDADARAFTGDSLSFAVLDATNIVFHDLTGGGKLKSISMNGFACRSAPDWFRFDPSGRRLAVHDTEADTNVFILDAQTGETLKTLRHIDHVYDVAWHPDGKLLATGCGYPTPTIQIWDSISGEPLRMWPTESQTTLCFNHQGNVLASSGSDGYTRLWEFGTWRELSSVYQYAEILHFSSDDLRLVTGSFNFRMLDFYELANGQELRTLYEAAVVSGPPVCSLIMNESEKLLAFRTHEGIELRDLKTTRLISFLQVEPQKSLVGFDSGCKNLVITGPEGLFRCPIARSDESVGVVSKPILVSTECADPSAGRMGWISENGKVCAVVGNDRCQLFRTDIFEKLAEIGIQSGRLGESALNWDGSLFASGDWRYTRARIWDTQTGALLKELQADAGRQDTSCTVAFSPDRRHLITGTASEYCFWALGSWSLVRRIRQGPENNFCPKMAFTRDGRMLAGTFARNKVRLYDVATGQELADLEAPNAREISGLAFNQDGTQLFIAEGKHAARVWDLRLIRQQLAALGLDW